MTITKAETKNFFNGPYEIETVSVSQALRRNFGKVKVKGTIIGISKLFWMMSKIDFYCDYCEKLVEIDFPLPVFDLTRIEKRCNQCNKFIANNINPLFKSAVIIELQDTETFNDMDRLPVFLFDNDTENIVVGETVNVIGDIQIINNNKKRYSTYLFGESIQYLNRTDLILTKSDIRINKRFNQIHKVHVIDKLVEMFDPSVVGYEYVKKGLLMSAVNSSEITSKKEKIHSLLIGDPGLAKSQLLKRVTQLIPNSNYVSAQNTSGKSITAIIDKTDENLFLRLGSIPQARGAISGLNEIGRMGLEDQGHILDVMQEEEFTKSAYGFTTKVQSPTTELWSPGSLLMFRYER